MRDIELYQQIMGLCPPWRVTEVRMDVKAQEIEVTATCEQTAWGCPTCGQRAHVHDYERRRWRHLDSCQFKTYLTAEVPRVKCAEHGTVTVQVPWAEGSSRFTALFERLAIDVLLECSIRGACDLLQISWDEADGIKQRAVSRGLVRKQASPIARLCVDEKSFGRGQDYITLVVNADDPKAAKVDYISDGRSQESLDAFWRSRSPAQLAAVEAVAMDLWEAYRTSTMAHVPAAADKIVHDPFHLIRHMNDAVNNVRKAEHRVLKDLGDERLVGTKQLWLYGYENVPENWGARLDDLRGQKLQTARAWAIKEMLRDFFVCQNPAEARAFFDSWYKWAIHCRLRPVKRVARMFKKHLANILTFFRLKLTTAASEGLNSRIAGIIKKACGYRNRARFKADVFFHVGGLNLYPALSQ
jgi:transposase